MSEIFKKILKFFSRNIGFFLINLAILLILLVFFINSSINNVDSLKNDLQNSIKEQILTESNIEKTDLEQANEYCKNNPQDGRCLILKEISENTELNQLFENIKATKRYINLLIFTSLILFVFGFLFVYLSIFNFLITSYRISVHLTIHNFLAALYFNFIPTIINKVPLTQKFQDITRNIPQEFVQQLLNIISNWIKTPLNQTIKLTIILGMIFLIISLILYFVKKKALKVKNKAK